MKLSRKQAINLFKALGYKTASKWNDDRLAAKIKGLPEIPEVADAKLEDSKMQDRLDKVLTALTNGAGVTIEGEEGEVVSQKEDTETDPNVQRIRDAKAKKAGEKEAKKKLGEKKVKGEKKAKKEKGPGIIDTIIECLRSKPHTKQQIVAALTKRFPDRPEEGMMKTVNVQVPTRLEKDKGLKVKRDDKGYYSI